MIHHTKTTNPSQSIHNQIRNLTLTGLFAALITTMTAFVGHIPVGTSGGYIHLGDSLIYLAAAILPTPYAITAAAIGGGLADLMTAPIWAPATLLIKSLLVLSFSSKKGTIVNPRNIFSAFLAAIITCSGYFLAELLIFGIGKAGFFAALAASAGPNLIQCIGSSIFFVMIGLFLDKTGYKTRI